MPIKFVKPEKAACLFEQLKAGDSFMVSTWPNDVFIKTATRYKSVVFTGTSSSEFNAFNAVHGNFAFFNGCDDVVRVNATLTIE